MSQRRRAKQLRRELVLLQQAVIAMSKSLDARDETIRQLKAGCWCQFAVFYGPSSVEFSRLLIPPKWWANAVNVQRVEIGGVAGCLFFIPGLTIEQTGARDITAEESMRLLSGVRWAAPPCVSDGAGIELEGADNGDTKTTT